MTNAQQVRCVAKMYAKGLQLMRVVSSVSQWKPDTTNLNSMTTCPKLLPLINEIDETSIIQKGRQKRDEGV